MMRTWCGAHHELIEARRMAIAAFGVRWLALATNGSSIQRALVATPTGLADHPAPGSPEATRAP